MTKETAQLYVDELLSALGKIKIVKTDIQHEVSDLNTRRLLDTNLGIAKRALERNIDTFLGLKRNL